MSITRTSLLLVAAMACGREEVTHYRIAKSAPAAAAAATAAAVPAAANLAWTLPPGWTQEIAGGMRYATLATPQHADVSVVMLPGEAGGEAANVNRWRGQLGLASLPDAALFSQRTEVPTGTGLFALYDYSNRGQRMIAALGRQGKNTWFFKLTGKDRAVAAARPDFLHLLESIHVEDVD
jgi:hypothetical protein